MTTLNSFKRNVDRIYYNAESYADSLHYADETLAVYEEAEEKIFEYTRKSQNKTQNKETKKAMENIVKQHLKNLNFMMNELYSEFPELRD